MVNDGYRLKFMKNKIDAKGEIVKNYQTVRNMLIRKYFVRMQKVFGAIMLMNSMTSSPTYSKCFILIRDSFNLYNLTYQ